MAVESLARGPMRVALFLMCALATGCTGTGSKGRQVRLVSSPRPYERDIPIPIGFKLVDPASEDRSTGVARLYLRHLYTGKADKYAVRNFYREQMPLARWTMVSDGNVRGVCTLRFEKASESCTVEIRDAGKGLGKRTEVQILASQEQRGSGAQDAQALRNQR
ncbi:MAG: hypothetical protein ACYSUI_07450 [Planctomycetota bacterium]